MIANYNDKKTSVIIRRMTKRALSVLLALALIMTLTGCAGGVDFDEPDDELSFSERIADAFEKTLRDWLDDSETDDGFAGSGDKHSNNSIAVYDEDGMEITTSESVIDMMENEDSTDSLLSGADLVSANDRLFDDEIDGYAYSLISDTEKTIYGEIYAVLKGHEKDVILSSTSPDDIDHAFKSVLVDHPEIFYVTGYSMTKYIKANNIVKIKFSGQYTMSKEDVDAKQPIIDAYVTKCLSGISQSASDYEKVKYVYEYLVYDNTYDLTAANNQNILSVCENQRTVCQGYAKMTQLLLNKLGLFCTLVNGEALNVGSTDGEGTIYIAEIEDGGWGSHVWNIVKVDGEYYNVDTTWGDASFTYRQEDGMIEEGPEISYDYLMVPDSMLTGSHVAKPVVSMPECNSIRDNFYVREGMYFTSVDRNQLDALFDKAYSEGEMYATMKCSDEAVFDQMLEYLFDDENIFDYINGTSVKYVRYPEKYILSVHL